MRHPRSTLSPLHRLWLQLDELFRVREELPTRIYWDRDRQRYHRAKINAAIANLVTLFLEREGVCL